MEPSPAVTSGEEGEIGPSQFTIPGLNPARQKEVYARSNQPMGPGTRPIRMMSEQDLNNAIQSLVNDLAGQAKNQWETTLPADLKVLADSILKETLSSVATAEVGDKVETFDLDIRARLSGLAAPESEIYNIALDRIKRKAADKDLVNVDESSLSYQPQNFDFPSKSLTLKITLSGQAQLRSTSSVIDKDMLAGLSAKEARDYLLSLPGVREVDIKLTPFWLRSIPRLKDHIRIEIQ